MCARKKGKAEKHVPYFPQQFSAGTFLCKFLKMNTRNFRMHSPAVFFSFIQRHYTSSLISNRSISHTGIVWARDICTISLIVLRLHNTEATGCERVSPPGEPRRGGGISSAPLSLCSCILSLRGKSSLSLLFIFSQKVGE